MFETPGEPLEPDRDAVEAVVCSAFQRAVITMKANHLGAALEPTPRRELLGARQLVSASLEVGDYLRIKPVVDGHIESVEDPIARGVDRLLEAHASIKDVDHELDVTLRLHHPPMHPNTISGRPSHSAIAGKML